MSTLLIRTPKTLTAQVIQDHVLKASYHHLEFNDPSKEKPVKF
jgi:hypothetical protein